MAFTLSDGNCFLLFLLSLRFIVLLHLLESGLLCFHFGIYPRDDVSARDSGVVLLVDGRLFENFEVLGFFFPDSSFFPLPAQLTLCHQSLSYVQMIDASCGSSQPCSVQRGWHCREISSLKWGTLLKRGLGIESLHLFHALLQPCLAHTHMSLHDVLAHFVRHLHLVQQPILFEPIFFHFPNVVLDEDGASCVTYDLLHPTTSQLFLGVVCHVALEAWLMIGGRAIVCG